jgi:hypothetical protein
MELNLETPFTVQFDPKVTVVRSGTPSAIMRQSKRMRHFLAILFLAAWAAAAPAQTAETQRTAKSSLTGCIDERDGQYVLTTDTDLQPIARLKPAAGSAEDNFAQHMGHKVTVGGVLSKETPLPTMTVQSVKRVSPVCSPATEQQK